MSNSTARTHTASRFTSSRSASARKSKRTTGTETHSELSDVLSRLSMIIDMERAQAAAAVAFLETALTTQRVGCPSRERAIVA